MVSQLLSLLTISEIRTALRIMAACRKNSGHHQELSLHAILLHIILSVNYLVERISSCIGRYGAEAVDIQAHHQSVILFFVIMLFNHIDRSHPILTHLTIRGELCHPFFLGIYLFFAFPFLSPSHISLSKEGHTLPCRYVM